MLRLVCMQKNKGAYGAFIVECSLCGLFSFSLYLTPIII